MPFRKYTLAIRCGNDAMQTAEDLARALRFAADVLESRATYCNAHSTEEHTGRIRDLNGNKVGTWTLYPDVSRQK